MNITEQILQEQITKIVKLCNKKIQEQKHNQNNPSRTKEIPLKGMTKEEAEQRLSSLSEDIKKFQQKQALDMKSLFNYQGNDW